MSADPRVADRPVPRVSALSLLPSSSPCWLALLLSRHAPSLSHCAEDPRRRGYAAPPHHSHCEPPPELRPSTRKLTEPFSLEFSNTSAGISPEHTPGKLCPPPRLVTAGGPQAELTPGASLQHAYGPPRRISRPGGAPLRSVHEFRHAIAAELDADHLRQSPSSIRALGEHS